MTWLLWRLRLAWARQAEGHRHWLAGQVQRHPYVNRRAWDDDLAAIWWRAEMATIARRRLELNEPSVYQGAGR